MTDYLTVCPLSQIFDIAFSMAVFLVMLGLRNY